MIKKLKKKNVAKINYQVFYFSAGLIMFFSLLAMCFKKTTDVYIIQILNWISSTFSWYYLLLATICVFFVIYISLSHFGSYKLGKKENSKPEFSLLQWITMLFGAGIGIDIMFFSVFEPVSHYINPPEGTGENVEAARQAMAWTLFHYGITGWSMYALVGVALGYSSYRYDLPLQVRSALYPFFKKGINSIVGQIVDIIAIMGTIFGISTTLGIGVVQLNYGLNVLYGVPDSQRVKMILIFFSVILVSISVSSRISKGAYFFSSINIILAIALIIFTLFAGDTNFLLNTLVLNIGDYLDRFISMTLNTFAFNTNTQWINNWTLFFWAWWMAWAPFVGLFLARISRGRTVQQFIIGTMTIPFIFSLIWLSIFGNSALYRIIHGDKNFALTAIMHPERGFYKVLKQYPAFTVTATVAIITSILFYITSADSGARMLSMFTVQQNIREYSYTPVWLRIFWSIVIGLLTLSMLLVNSISTLQNATVIIGLPCSFFLIFVIVGMFKLIKYKNYE